MQSTSNTQHQSVPIAIIGIGCIFPKARNLHEYWINLKEGVDAITEVPETHWNPEEYFHSDPKHPDKTYAKRGGFLPTINFNPLEFGIPPKALEATDTSQLLSLVAVQEALRDAGYLDRELDRDRVSVILGVTGTQELVIPLGARLGHPIWRRALREAGIADAVADDVVERISNSYVEWQENSFPGLLGNVIAGRVANRFDFGGTNCTVDAACASSLSAIHLANMELADGQADMVLAGGVDTFNHIFMYMCFSKTPALSPSGHARPFDHRGDGTTLGEGVGIIVLKRLEDAKRDDDKIYAVIKGMGSSSDGKGNAIYAPSIEGQMRAFRKAYKHANVTPDTIELMEAHGTGTKVGDATEIKSLTEVYKVAQTNGSWCALGSVKSQIGHAKSAAGVAGLIKAAMALHHKVLPPTIKVEKPAPELKPGETPFYVNTEKRPWLPSLTHPRRAAVSSFGFGGSNFHCVLEEYRGQKEQIDWSGNTQILAFSAENIAQLSTALHEMNPKLPRDKLRSKALQLRKTFDPKHPHRLLIVVEHDPSTSLGTDLAKSLKNAAIMLEKNREKRSWSTPDGIFYGNGKIPGTLGVIFPGQGAQYVGMLHDAACQFPQFQEIIEIANRVFQQDRNSSYTPRLSDLIYPSQKFSEKDHQKDKALLQSTEIAQPAIGAVSLGLLKILEHFEIFPESVAGHSYGELAALCAAGVLDTETFFGMSKLRGQLMGQKTGDKGSMLAVQGDEKFVNHFIKEQKIDLVIANKNSPQQTVLSGATNEIERAASIFKEQRIRCKQLRVAAAFHSSFVSDASGAFLEALQQVEIHQPRLPVYADSTAACYPDEIMKIRELLAGQLANPVEFVKIVENMYISGVRTFLEVGPSSQMKGLIEGILEGKHFEALSVDSSAGKRSGETELARTLSQLAALGYHVRLSAWDESALVENDDTSTPKKGIMAVPISGANYFKPKPSKPVVKEPSTSVPNNGSGTQNLPISEVSHRTAPKTMTTIRPELSTKPLSQPTMSTPTPAPPVQDVHSQRERHPASPSKHSTESIPGESRDVSTGFAQEKTGQEPAQAVYPSRSAITPQSSIDFSEALRMTQENLRALQQFQQQTADLHRQFLEGQEATRQTFERLFSQQQLLLGSCTQPSSQPQPPMEPIPPNANYQSVASTAPGHQVTARDSTPPPQISDQQAPTASPETLRRPSVQAPQPEPVIPSSAEVSPKSEPPVMSSSVADTSLVEKVLLDAVSEKTGYPVDMLDLDMGLDTDLGIDSIKRVEILSALQEKLPNAPEITSEHIGMIQNLRQIVDFLTPSFDQGKPISTPSQEGSKWQAASSGPDSKEVEKLLLEVISEKTGYPQEMLELDMGLDADLGIDSIKRVEILSALQEKLPNAPEITSEHIGTIQNLRQIVDFLSVSLVTPLQHNVSNTVQTASAGLDENQVKSALLQVVAEKTGHPQDMLDLDMDLDTGLGIDSMMQAAMITHATQQDGAEPATETLTSDSEVSFSSFERSLVVPVKIPDLHCREAILLPPGSTIWMTDDETALTSTIEAGLQSRGFQTQRISLNHLPELAALKAPSGLVILSPPGAKIQATFLKNAFKVLQAAGTGLRHTTSVFVTVSRLDGAFGFGNLNPDINPLSGGLAGLAKTVGREWLEMYSKAIDLAADYDNIETAATAIIDEMFLVGPGEVGISAEGRITLQLEPAPLIVPTPDAFQEGHIRGETGMLTKDDVIVITGGAKGVTAECAVALARAYQPIIILLGRSPTPTAEAAWLSDLREEAEIKKAIIDNAGRKITPKELDEECRRIMSNREIQRNIARIEAAGANVVYRPVDVRDVDAVKQFVGDVQQEFGTITGLIHGAGILADRKIEDKTEEQFDKVYGVKVEGITNFLSALASNPLKALVLFSSTTARLGRIGQVDYAIANEVLNKIAQRQARLRPACRVVAINWGPWAGGMVTPDLEKLFKNEGVGLIPLEIGADYLVQELSLPVDQSAPVEVVVLGENTIPHTALGAQAPCLQTASQLTVAFERTLDIEQYPFLKSHVIDGRAVLPMAITIEWLAHAALHNNPGFMFHGFNELRVLKGVILQEHESCRIQVVVGDASKNGKTFIVPVEMHEIGADGQKIRHARAEFILTTKLPQGERAITSRITEPYQCQNGDIYRKYLFHGADFHGIEEVEGCSAEGIIARIKAAPHPSAWIKQPLRNHWLTDPLMIDGSFQMMILWSFQQYRSGSLPAFVRRYRQFKPKFSSDSGRIVAQVTKSEQHSALATIEFLDLNGNLVARMEDYECTIDPSLNQAFRRNRLMSEE